MNTGSVIPHAAKSAVITAWVSAFWRERWAASRTVARDGAVARDERDAEAAVAHDARERRDLDLLVGHALEAAVKAVLEHAAGRVSTAACGACGAGRRTGRSRARR
jgi:hypothetical protein